MPLVCFLSIVFVYTLSINVLDVSQILVGSVIFGAKLDDYDYDYDYDYEMLLLRHKEIQYNMS